MATCTGARRERRAHWRQGGAPAGSPPPATDGPSTRSPDHRQQEQLRPAQRPGQDPSIGPPPAGQPFGRDPPCALGARRPLRGTSGLVRELRPRCLTSCARGTSRASGNHPAVPVDHPNEPRPRTQGERVCGGRHAQALLPGLAVVGAGTAYITELGQGVPVDEIVEPEPGWPGLLHHVELEEPSAAGAPATPPTEAPHCVPLAPGSGSAIRGHTKSPVAASTFRRLRRTER